MTLEDLLDGLASGPRTLSQLSLRLQVTHQQAEAALLQLQRGGYVDRAIPDEGACHTGCGMCSMKSFCPTQAAAADPQETWRLTNKAQSRVRPPA